MKQTPNWVMRGGLILMLVLCAGLLSSAPAGAQPDPTPTPEQPQLTLTLRADNPVAGSGRIRLSVDIENQGADWPSLLWLRVIVPPNNMTIIQPLLDGGEVQFVTADSTSSTFEIPAPGNTAQQVRTFTVLLDLWPGTDSAANEVQVELGEPDGAVLVAEILPAGEAAKLAQARPTEMPTATDPAATEPAGETNEQPGSGAAGRDEEETSAGTETAANEGPGGPQAQEILAQTTSTPAISDPLPTVTVPAASTPTPTPSPAGGFLSSIRSVWILVFIIGGIILLGGLVLFFFLIRYWRRRSEPPKVALRPVPVDSPSTTSPAGAAALAGITTENEEPVNKNAYLELLSAPGGAYPLGPDRVTIGRAEGNQILLPENVAGRETLSRFHAAIYWQGGQHMVEDLESQNGVMVNGRATPKNVLNDGDELLLGQVKCQYRRGEPDENQGEKQS